LEAGDVLAELKKGICTGFGHILDSDAPSADIQLVLEAVVSDGVSVSTTREAFRILSLKVAAMDNFHCIGTFASGGTALNASKDSLGRV
jgi:hypothetical protein